MKVPASIRQLYDDQKGISDRLRESVDRRMVGLKKERWHYESRVKGLASFALKIESGRFQKPQALEDFVACTVVVANAAEIAEAETLVNSNFALKERRPPHHEQTFKAPDSFLFDDLRLYVSIADTPVEPPTDLAGVVFEVQIKTFLQHAWAIATHDLLYKADDANWSKERIAYQIKAMLEHAEVAIQEAEALAQSASLAKEDKRTQQVRQAIAILKSQWNADELPFDVRRLAGNITKLLGALKLSLERLEKILNEGKAERAGAHPVNLSPYGTVVQYLFFAEKDRMIALLKDRSGKAKVLIPEEIELPANLDRSKLANAVFLKPSGDTADR